MTHEARRLGDPELQAVLSPSAWGLEDATTYASTRYVAPPDVTRKWGRSRLPGVPSVLHLPPVDSTLERAIAQRPFLRYGDFLQAQWERQPAVLPAAPEVAPMPRPAQLAAARN